MRTIPYTGTARRPAIGVAWLCPEAGEMLAVLAGSMPWHIGMVALVVAVLLKFAGTVVTKEVPMRLNAMTRSVVAVGVDVAGAIVADVAVRACRPA